MTLDSWFMLREDRFVRPFVNLFFSETRIDIEPESTAVPGLVDCNFDRRIFLSRLPPTLLVFKN